MSKTWVAVSANTIRDYSFMLPLSSLFWRDVIGHTPLLLMVGDWEGDARSRVSLAAIQELGFEVHPVKEIPGYLSANVAQNVREHAAVDLRIADEDWIIPSDADLWPFKPEFYRQHLSVPESTKAIVLYCNGDGFVSKEDFLSKADVLIRAQTIPTCHVIMRAATWRSLYQIKTGDDLQAVTKRTMDSWIPQRIVGKSPSDAAFVSWMSDQDIVTWQLCRQDWFPQDAIMVPRFGYPPEDRLCRSNVPSWPVKDIGKYVDCHGWKAPDSPEHWNLLRPLIAHFLPKWVEWADAYRDRYYRSYNP